MHINHTKYFEIVKEAGAAGASLVAVSKTKPPEAIKELYDLGQRDFGENYVQELVDKQAALPKDIRWHFIGHLQSNKIKYIAPFVHLIHGIDSLKLLREVDKQAKKANRIIDVLLQVHVAQEETKFGFDENELKELLNTKEKQEYPNTHVSQSLLELKAIKIIGLMGMASFSDAESLIRSEFKKLKIIYDDHVKHPTPSLNFQTLSMGMSGDYKIALEEGSTMIRIGSLLFGKR
ncbi:MAG TPA: YggS family pyridoxal phosphate-dependent enzyme [Flavisolibacter sp.]|nr:YggS family pyridoxal phosphate-dependent enzyme [Flavisolibacter sp.]